MKQEFESYHFYQQQVQALDKVIEACYSTFDKQENRGPLKKDLLPIRHEKDCILLRVWTVRLFLVNTALSSNSHVKKHD